MLALAIDTASDTAGLALMEDGELLAESTWRSRQSHSRQLLPTLEWLLRRCEREKADLGAAIVCLGPGSYAGLRVGLSTAKALAFGLELPLAGVGRLAADAYPIAMMTDHRVVAVHAAGRAELAWAAYKRGEDGLQELYAPQLSRAEAFLEVLRPGDLVSAERNALGDDFQQALTMRDCRIVDAPPNRVVAVAKLGWQRLQRSQVDNPDTLVPLYLRAPAIGPQPPR